MKLFSNIRFYVLCTSVLLAIFFFLLVFSLIPDFQTQLIRLEQIYAFVAVGYLYLALLATPLLRVYPMMPFRGQYVKARRALGVSAAFFGLMHGTIAFFGQLGGFAGLPFLGGTYILAISLSFTALLILLTLASTSFDAVIKKMTFKKWKMLHRLVYVALLFIVIHALLLGTHFAVLSSAIPLTCFFLLAFLLVLESIRIDIYLKRKVTKLPTAGVASVVIFGAVVGLFIFIFLPSSGGGAASLGVHAQHIELAKQAQQGNLYNPNLANIQGGTILQGDRTLRYTVSFQKPDVVSANQDTTLTFTVFNASTGNQVTDFQPVFTKLIHLVIVSSDLAYFSHIHPDFQNGQFVITTQFPTDGIYHLYIDFQPKGAIEQQFAFSLPVGSGAQSPATQAPDKNLTKTFGDYEVSLDTHGKLIAKDMAIGLESLTFTIKDAKTKKSITTLQPYLGSFGHLVMINEKSYDYLHVHPSNLIAPKPTDKGGPTVEFLPLGLYGPIKPGIYRLFAQFNPDGKLFVADFTVRIE